VSVDRSYAVLPTLAAPPTRYRLGRVGRLGSDPLDQWRRPASPGCAAPAIAGTPMAPTRIARLRRACDRR
jgi:hypothetical protein